MLVDQSHTPKHVQCPQYPRIVYGIACRTDLSSLKHTHLVLPIRSTPCTPNSHHSLCSQIAALPCVVRQAPPPKRGRS